MSATRRPLTALTASLLAGMFTVMAASADDVGRAVAEAGAVDTQLTDELKLANEALYEAFTGRDIWRMGELWVKDESASSIFPAQSLPQYGWENVRKSWQYSFDHVRDIKISSLAGIIMAKSDEVGAVAWLIDSNRFEGFHTQTGQPFLMPNMLTTKIFERRDGKWLLVHYHAHQPRLQPPTAAHEETLKPPLVAVDAPEVEAADDRFYKALSELNLDEMSKIWAPHDVTAVQPDFDTPFVGRQNVLASWQAIFDHNKKIGFSNVKRQVFRVGDYAWTVGSYEFHAIRRKNDEFVHIPNVLVTKIFEKNGHEWQLVHYHAHIGPLGHTHQMAAAGGDMAATGSDMAAAGSDKAGDAAFAKCAPCHQVGPDAKNLMGPHLNEIIGRTAASVSDYGMYSSGMKKLREQGFIWTEENLYEWIADPKAMLPDSPMSFAFQGVPDVAERDAIIAYLRSFSNLRSHRVH